MKYSQNLNDLSIFDLADPEDNEVASFALIARDVEREHSWCDIAAFVDPHEGGSVNECCYRLSDCFCICFSLNSAEMFSRPVTNLSQVVPGCRGEPHPPDLAFDCHLLRCDGMRTDAPAISALTCASSASAVSKVS